MTTLDLTPSSAPAHSRSRSTTQPAGHSRPDPDPATPGRLLAGPPSSGGPESLAAHIARLGPLDLPLPSDPRSRSEARRVVAEAGILGRGGGEFPLHRKLTAAAEAAEDSGSPPLIVVNGSEGEPASRKDRTLLDRRPHLVLDGAAFEAGAVGGAEVVLYLEPERRAAWEAALMAIEERRAAGLLGPVFRLAAAAPRYVAGETSAVVTALETGLPAPSRRPAPAASSGVNGRPTVVSNAETAAHVALAARYGPEWFRRCGTEACPGSSLVTLAGAVRAPGTVVELLRPVSGAHLLERAAGIDPLHEVPRAVLIGGYAGRFVSGAAFAAAEIDRGPLRGAGVPLGCGLLAVIPESACGLRVALRLVEYLSRESAGQCGPCVYGLPALVGELRRILAGSTSRRAFARVQRIAVSVVGHGACGHPDGAVAMLESALQLFRDDALAHLKGRDCGGRGQAGWLPIPEEDASWGRL